MKKNAFLKIDIPGKVVTLMSESGRNLDSVAPVLQPKARLLLFCSSLTCKNDIFAWKKQSNDL